LMPQLVFGTSWEYYGMAFGCENTRSLLSVWIGGDNACEVRFPRVMSESSLF